MKTLKDKEIDIAKSNMGLSFSTFNYKDVKEHLNNFYNAYWEESEIGNKNKKYISCDELDYLLNKHFGNIIEIKTLQILENE